MLRPTIHQQTSQVSVPVSRPLIKCTNCCTPLLTEFRKDGTIPLGVTMGAVPRPDGQRSFIPMSTILNSVLKLPMINAWTPRATFCPSCARLVMQIYIASLELAKVSKLESHLHRVHKQIEAILHSYNLTSTAVSESNVGRQARNTNLSAAVLRNEMKTDKVPIILRTRSLACSSDSHFEDDSMHFDSNEMGHKDVSHSKQPVVPMGMKNKPIQKSDNILRTPKQASATNSFTGTGPTVPEQKSQSSFQISRSFIPVRSIAATPNPNPIKFKPDPNAALSSAASKKLQLPQTDGTKKLPIDCQQKEVDGAVKIELIDLAEPEPVEEGPPLPTLKSENLRRVTRFYLRRYTGKCSRCDEKFRRVSLEEVETHFDIEHQGMLEFICNICDQRLFLRSAPFRRHYKSHADSDESKISMRLRSTCGLNLKAKVLPKDYNAKPISEAAKLERRKAIDLALKHRQKIRASRFPVVTHPPCPRCGKVLKSKKRNALQQHIEVHERVKVRVHRQRVTKIFCDICGRPCYNRHHKKMHERTHLNVTERKILEAEEGIQTAEFLCSECDSLIKHHSRIHEDPSKRRVYRCEEQDCDFKCLEKRTLYNHHKQFHDPNTEPKFKCKQCSQSFRDFLKYKEHQMTECDAWNRPFVCDQSPCRKRFKAKQGLVLHYLGVHKMKPVVAREKVYPDLDCPEWVGRKYASKYKNKK